MQKHHTYMVIGTGALHPVVRQRLLVSHCKAMAEAADVPPLVHEGYMQSQHLAHVEVQDNSGERVKEAWAEEPGDVRGETAVVVGRTRGEDKEAPAAVQAFDCVVPQRKTQREAEVHLR